MRIKSNYPLIWLWLLPLTAHASFIESTLGTAVVNDAVATYYNPAGLTQMKNPQIIPLMSIADTNTHFSGQLTQPSTGFTQTGTSNGQSQFYLPSFYLGIPATDHLSLGLAVVSNFLTRDLEGSSILRYNQSDNNIQNIDVVPAAGFKVNQYFSIGVGLNFSYAHFILKPISGLPGQNIPDSQSRNESSGTGLGGDIGFQVKPSAATVIGFNYRSAITYRLTGTSIFEGTPELVSNHYGFTYWAPARAVLSINQMFTPKLGIVGTVQHIQFSIFNTISIHGIAVQSGTQASIINASVPQYLRDTWLFTLGTNYRMTPQWVMRLAGTYNQSAGNPHYQVANGDSFIVGVSSGYDINKNVTIDGSYAHAFIQRENISISNARNIINGVNDGDVNSVSLKVTINVC